jgi:hypothetical protein
MTEQDEKLAMWKKYGKGAMPSDYDCKDLPTLSYVLSSRGCEVDHPFEVWVLSPIGRSQLSHWINDNFKKQKSANVTLTSYGMKLCFELDGGFSITNGMFKGAMLLCGFKPAKCKHTRWRFNVDHDSIADLKERGILPI